MGMSPKVCPRCQQPSVFNTPGCPQCGYIYTPEDAPQGNPPPPVRAEFVSARRGSPGAVLFVLVLLAALAGSIVWLRQNRLPEARPVRQTNFGYVYFPQLVEVPIAESVDDLNRLIEALADPLAKAAKAAPNAPLRSLPPSLRKMEKEKRVFFVPQKARVHRLSTSGNFTHLEITEGAHLGRRGWVGNGLFYMATEKSPGQ